MTNRKPTIETTSFSLHIMALIPIWLYRGRQGYHSKTLQYFCYVFYPLHLLVLGVLKITL